MVVACLAGWVAYLSDGSSRQVAVALPLTGTAVVMFAGDVVTGAFEIAPCLASRQCG